MKQAIVLVALFVRDIATQIQTGAMMKSYRMRLAVFFLVVAGASPLPEALAVRNSPQESDRARLRDEWQRPGDVMDALGAKPGRRVADIGCGFGYFTFFLDGCSIHSR
jgi:hypothetical protein